MTRADRLSALIRTEISDILHRKVADPRLRFCSITRVLLTEDLKHAQIHVSDYGNAVKEIDVKRGMTAASRFIRGELGKRLHTRTVPELAFHYDESLKQGDRVLERLKEIEKERESDATSIEP
jgi:ribosome-binding factor A